MLYSSFKCQSDKYAQFSSDRADVKFYDYFKYVLIEKKLKH